MNNELYAAAGVPDRHKSFRPDQSIVPEWSQAYNSLKMRLNEGVLLALIGNRGSGKTQLGSCLIGFCAHELGKSCLYQKSMDIFLRIREANKLDGDSEKKAVAEFLKPFLLVIDAYEVRGDTPFENRTMDHIIDKRYDLCKSTVIISNDNEESLKKSLGSSICDRMKETGGIIVMNWKSLRGNKNAPSNPS
jgi:DNA replication protein DnaC